MAQKPFDLITCRTSHRQDQGWAWVVMMAAFGSFFIVIGYQRSFGLLFVEFQDRYGYSSTVLSVVNGTQMLTYSFSTLLVMNYLLKKISIRTSTLLGAILQGTGIAACSVSSSVTSLIVFQGVFFGLGHSLLYCPTILIVSQYFEKHRSVATAVAMCGSSAGGIAFPYISRLLLHVFGLKGALLLLGALTLQQTVFFALYQPIIVETSPSKDAKDSSLQRTTELENGNEMSFVVVDDQNPAKNFADEDNNQYKQIACDGSESLLTTDAGYSNNMGRLFSSQTLGPTATAESKSKERLYSSQNISPAREIPGHHLSKKSKEFLSILGKSSSGLEHTHHSSQPVVSSLAARERKSRDSLQLLPSEDTAIDRDACDGARSLTEENLEKSSWIPSVMRLPSFWLVALYNVGGFITAGLPAVFIPPLSVERGLTSGDGAFFLMASAVTDLLARVVTGTILHFDFLLPRNLALIPLALQTVIFCMTALFHDFYTILLLILTYGFCSSMFWTLQSLVMIDILGLGNLAAAMGFYAVIYGVTTSASFPLAGWLHDHTGSYSSTFHYFGAMGLLAGLSLVVVSLPRYRTSCKASAPCTGRRRASSSVSDR